MPEKVPKCKPGGGKPNEVRFTRSMHFSSARRDVYEGNYILLLEGKAHDASHDSSHVSSADSAAGEDCPTDHRLFFPDLALARLRQAGAGAAQSFRPDRAAVVVERGAERADRQ